MKIKIAPEKLKPGQLFDAREKASPEHGYFDHTFERLYFYGDGKPGILAKEEGMSPLSPDGYDFFIEVPHPELVASLVKSGEDILNSLTPHKCHVWHMASCVPSEAGELFDAVKKHVIYEKELDRENVVEELGDLESMALHHAQELEAISKGIKHLSKLKI